MTERLGILGGSFDPPHVGHLILAECAADALALDRVLFLPAGRQPLKQGLPTTPAPQRVAMVAAAIAGNPRFELSRADVDYPGLSYTVDTLGRLRAECGPEARFWFLIGEDALASLLAWRNPGGILARARLGVAARPGVRLDWPALDAALPDLRAHIDPIPAPLMAISATELRARAAAGHSLRYQVHPAVADYIAEHRLYQTDSAPRRHEAHEGV